MTDPDLHATMAADDAAVERTIAVAREDFNAGRGPRWVRAGRHLVDLAPPARAIDRPAPAPVVAAPPRRALCPTCGHEIEQPDGAP